MKTFAVIMTNKLELLLLYELRQPPMNSYRKQKKALHYWRTYHFFWLRFHLILMALLVFVFFLDPLASHSLMFIFIHFAYIFFSSLAPFSSWVCTTCIKSGAIFMRQNIKKYDAFNSRLSASHSCRHRSRVKSLRVFCMFIQFVVFCLFIVSECTDRDKSNNPETKKWLDFISRQKAIYWYISGWQAIKSARSRYVIFVYLFFGLSQKWLLSVLFSPAPHHRRLYIHLLADKSTTSINNNNPTLMK